jgi:hypothetical protein
VSSLNLQRFSELLFQVLQKTDDKTEDLVQECNLMVTASIKYDQWLYLRSTAAKRLLLKSTLTRKKNISARQWIN